MTRVCQATFVLAALYGGAATAQRASFADTGSGGATVDGVIGADEYTAGRIPGINSGFGNVIGSLSMFGVETDDAGNVVFGLEGGGAPLNDIVVIYIDSLPGGVSGTGTFVDGADAHRKAISGYDPSAALPNRATLTFGAKFAPDYAIAFGRGFAGLWKLGEVQHEFVAALEASDLAAGAVDYELPLALDDIGLVPGDEFGFLVTLINPDGAYRADEYVGVKATTVPSGTMGLAEVILGDDDYVRMTTAGPRCGDGVVGAGETCEPGGEDLLGILGPDQSGNGGSFLNGNLWAQTFTLTKGLVITGVRHGRSNSAGVCNGVVTWIAPLLPDGKPDVNPANALYTLTYKAPTGFAFYVDFVGGGFLDAGQYAVIFDGRAASGTSCTWTFRSPGTYAGGSVWSLSGSATVPTQSATRDGAVWLYTTDPASAKTCDMDCTAPACGDGLVNAVSGETCEVDDATSETLDLIGETTKDVLHSGNAQAAGLQTFTLTQPAIVTSVSFFAEGACTNVSTELRRADASGDSGPAYKTVSTPGTTTESGPRWITVSFETWLPEGVWGFYVRLGSGCKIAGSTASTYPDGLFLFQSSGAGMKPQSGDAAIRVQLDRRGTATCDSACTAVSCGDGVVSHAAGEACDDGNATDGDGCSACQIDQGWVCAASPSKCVTFCGSGVVDPGEACDDGPNGSHVCDKDCTPTECGDGLRNNFTEDCDDGGESMACNADCSAVLCGDGVTNTTSEECDGGDGSLLRTVDSLSFSATGLMQAAGVAQTVTLPTATTIGSAGVYMSAQNGHCDGLTLTVVKVVDEKPSTDPADVLGTGTVVSIGPGDEGWVVVTFDTPLELSPGMVALTIVPAAAGTGCAWLGSSGPYAGGATWDLSNLTSKTWDLAVRLYPAAGPAAPTGNCRADCTAIICGDGVTEGDEQCDDAGESGTCNADCTIASCGDGKRNASAGEACDTAGDSATCNADCTVAACGDGKRNAAAGEACDSAGDSATCDADCTVAACGDGKPNSAAGEACDTAGNSATCNLDCTIASCGDGKTNAAAGEACDTAGDSATCNADCTVAACGDGKLNAAAGEACDAAGESATCNADCTVAACGDGKRNAAAGEACDSAGDSATCNADCTVAACGDGKLNAAAGEACDTAGNSATCNIDCTVASCGDGKLNAAAGEACDTAGDSATCNADCTAAACGDGKPNAAAGEACDTAGDSETCNADCTAAACGDGKPNAAAGEACDTAGDSATCNADCTTAACGDGKPNAAAGEACDTAGDSATCNADCTSAACGDGKPNAAAGEACDTAGDSATCNADCTAAACGDGKTNAAAGEACDTAGDSVTCNADCTTAACGDGKLNAAAGEACDTAGDSATCNADCTAAACGDGKSNAAAGEACDTAGDSETCNADCTTAACGDGKPNAAAGEACDTAGDSATCNADCTAVTCGDGKLNAAAGETCDDGAAVDGDGCSAACTVELGYACSGTPSSCAKTCGNETLDPGEACDRGPGGDADCNADCTLVSCGDGKLNAAAGEACDTAGESATCNADCTAATCGDGKPNAAAGEACDTAGDSETCNADCTATTCGDGKLNAAAAEACDDGAAVDGDGCSAACAVELGYACSGSPSSCAKTCGNGTLDPGEACDQGPDGDADCNSDCTVASCGDGKANAAAGEACDTTVESATCDADCTAVECGDDVINAAAGESCDDGGTASGDGCDATCRYEPGAVVISEIFVGHAGAGAFVELHSTVGFDVDLGGLTLGSTSLEGCTGSLTLAAGERRVIAFGGDGPDGAVVCQDATLPEDTLALNAGDEVLDAVDFGELACHRAKAEVDGFTRSIERTDDGFCLSDPAALFGAATDSAGSPGAAGTCAEQACDGDDDDCNGLVDDGLSDQDDDGVCDAEDCDPAVAACSTECGLDTDDDDAPDCADLDDDGDGLPDSDEAGLGTSPVKFDSDGDGVSDGDEVACASDPTSAESAPEDVDGDGQCDHLSKDTDDDGVADALERLCGNDPELASDVPTAEDLQDDDSDGVLNCLNDEPAPVAAASESGCGATGPVPPSSYGAIALLALALIGARRRRRASPPA